MVTYTLLEEGGGSARAVYILLNVHGRDVVAE